MLIPHTKFFICIFYLILRLGQSLNMMSILIFTFMIRICVAHRSYHFLLRLKLNVRFLLNLCELLGKLFPNVFIIIMFTVINSFFLPFEL